MSHSIEVENLTKVFQFSVKDQHQGVIRNFFNPSKKIITAVDHISFSVEPGEALAFIGPNGAGKSTSIKMLTGILYPTDGSISVLGLNPQKDRRKLSYRIGTVFGQRSQLIFNLPVRDSFRLFGKIYELPAKKILEREAELSRLFEIEDILDQPVRKLSLGQRMRCEIAVSLIHNPEIIFLDEPTIGLDIVAKRKLREVLSQLNSALGTTIFLTSHDAGDIEALCRRTIIVNHGRVVLDTPTDALQRKFLTQKHIRVEFQEKIKIPRITGAKLIEKDDTSAQFLVDTRRHPLNVILKDLVSNYEIKDMDVENSSLEEIISSIYQQKA